MKAWQVLGNSGKGLEQSLRLTETKQPPSPKKGQVLVKVLAMSLNPADYKYPERFPTLGKLVFGHPLVPGLDFCGKIVELPGSAAPVDLKIDQLVWGRLGLYSKYGPLAEYALVSIDGLVPVPVGVKVEEAAGIGTAAVTAYQAIVPHVKEGSTVFLNGGSGGTGVFAIQIAKLLGCHVVTACSGANAEFCKNLGADEIIDYRTSDLVKELAAKGPVFDLVVDFVGNKPDLHAQSVQFLKPEGLFMLVAGRDDTIAGFLNLAKSWGLPSWLGGVPRRWKIMLASNRREELLKISKWMEERKVKTVLDSTFAFEDAQKAIAKLKTGRAKGKIVISIQDQKKGK